MPDLLISARSMPLLPLARWNEDSMGIQATKAHRRFMPRGSWVMTQTWHDLLFAHWPVQPEALGRLVPSGVELDTYDGQAWLGIVAFRLSGIRLRGLPEIPMISGFPEVNVRTYVTANGKPGVYFLSLDADNPLVTAIARPWFHLAYHNARIRFARVGERVEVAGWRRGSEDARFCAMYQPCSEPFIAPPHTLEHWLTERYCYYAPGNG